MQDLKKKDDRKKDEKACRSGLGRRDLMRLGAGAAVAGMLKAPAAFAQQGQQLPPNSPTSPLTPREHGREQHFPDIRESQEVITTVQPFVRSAPLYCSVSVGGAESKSQGGLIHRDRPGGFTSSTIPLLLLSKPVGASPSP